MNLMQTIITYAIGTGIVAFVGFAFFNQFRNEYKKKKGESKTKKVEVMPPQFKI